jgi:TP901 family phage tail tape measure protein
MIGGGAPNIKLATLFYEIETRTKGVDKDLKDTERSLGSLSKFIEDHPKAALAGLGVAALAAGAMVVAGAVKMAAQFESEMAKVNTVAQVSKEELAALGDEVQATFRELPVENTKQLTDALYQVVSSGISVGKAMDVVKVATKTAVGGFTDAETAVDAITSVMNAYKDENLSAARAADVLAKTVEVGKVEMNEIAGSIGNVVGVASVMGVSIEELGAVTAAMSLNGVAASEGITSIRAAINDIIRPTELFKKEFPELAANFNETRLRGDGLVKFMQDFIKESDGSSEAMKRAFNSVEGYKLAVMAAKDGGQGFADMLVKMKDATGAVDKQFEEVNKTAAAQYQIIKNNLSSAFTELGTAILPVVNTVLSGLVSLLNQFNGAAAKARAQGDAKKLAEEAASSFDGTSRAFLRSSKAMREFIDKVDDGKVALKDLDTETLAGLQTRLLKMRDSGQLAGKAIGQVGEFLNKVVKEQSDRVVQAQLEESRAREAGRVKAEQIEKQKAEAAKKRLGEVAEANKEQAKEEEKLAKATMDAAEKTFREVSDKLEALKKKRLSLMQQLEDATVASTRSTVDDMQLQLNRAIEKLVELGATVDQVGQFRALKEGAIRAQQNIELVAEAMKDLGTTSKDIKQLEEALLRVNYQITQQIAIRNRPGISDAERVAAEKNIETLTTARTGLETRIANARKDGAVSAKATEDSEEKAASAGERALKSAVAKANAIQVAAQGAIKLAAGFGLVSESTGKMLSDIITIAAQVPVIVDAAVGIAESIGSGAATGGAWGALANGLLAVGGVIADGIAGDKAARKERAKVMGDNTRAIQMLTKVQGDLLRVQVSGRDYSTASAGLKQFLDKYRNRGDFREFGKKGLEGVDPSRELEALGINFEDIKEIAKALGITLDGQIGSYRKLLQAMQEADLSGFVSGFAGALEELDAQFEINAEKFPTATARLEALFDLLADPIDGSRLFDSLKDLDLTDADNVSSALEQVQALFERMRKGELSPEDLGGLNLSDLKGIIARLNSELRALQEEAASPDAEPKPTDKPKPKDKDSDKDSDKDPDVTPQQVTVTESMATQIERLVKATNADSIAALTKYVAGILSLNTALEEGLGALTAGRASIDAPSATLRTLTSQLLVEPPPSFVGNKPINIDGAPRSWEIHVHLHTQGVVVGDMETLAKQVARMATSEIDSNLGRLYEYEIINSGNRRVTVE